MYIRRSSCRLALKTRLRPSRKFFQTLFPPQWLQTCLVSPMECSSLSIRNMYRREARYSAVHFGKLFAMRTVLALLLFLAACASPGAAPALDRGLVASPEPHVSEAGAAV